MKRRASLPSDTLIGVFLSMTLGLGICLLVAVTKRFNIHQIEAVMFGSILTVTDADLGLLLAAGIVVAGVLAWHYNALLLDSVSPPLARVSGVSAAALEYLFVVLLTVAIVISLKVIGALLVEALVIVPAASGRNLARSTVSYLVWSVLTALAAGLGGLALSTRLLVPSGGAIVLALAALFFATLAIHGLRARVAG
ncbi:MAG: metal ABC transporter permease [Deltaproteobacteria bacterium]|nr:metal ABC transporter permease [Deltaproteobacteria bacterium]